MSKLGKEEMKGSISSMNEFENDLDEYNIAKYKETEEIFDDNDIVDAPERNNSSDNNKSQSIDLFEDIISHGFRDPVTNHAFQVTSFIIPKPCIYCKLYLYPFSGVVNCLYCKTMVHRECMKDIPHCSNNILVKQNSIPNENT